MTQESKFNEFFEELGGIEYLKLMVNMKDIKYDKRIHPLDTVTFTVGWDKQITFNVTINKSYLGPPIEEKYYYYLYSSEYCWRLRLSDIKTYLSDLIKYHTGNEIFPFS